MAVGPQRGSPAQFAGAHTASQLRRTTSPARWRCRAITGDQIISKNLDSLLNTGTSEGGRSQAAKDLDSHENVMRKWVRELRDEPPRRPALATASKGPGRGNSAATQGGG